MVRGTVLVVEDEPLWQQDHKAHLMMRGYEVEVASDSLTALTILKRDGGNRIRYVLVDYCLRTPEFGDESGSDFIDEARELPFGSLLKFVMVTAVPLQQSNNDARAHIFHKARIEEESQVTVIDKALFDDRERAYRRITELFTPDAAPTVVYGTPVRRLLVGLGLNLDVLKAGNDRQRKAAEAFPKHHVRNPIGYVPLADFSRNGDVEGVLQALLVGPSEEGSAGWQKTDGWMRPRTDAIITDRGIAVQIGSKTPDQTTWENVVSSNWARGTNRHHRVLDPLAFAAEQTIAQGKQPGRVFLPSWYRFTKLSPRTRRGRAGDPEAIDRLDTSRDNAAPGYSVVSGEINAVESAVKAALSKTRDFLSEQERKAIKDSQGAGPLQLVIATGGDATEGYEADFDIRLVLYSITPPASQNGTKAKKATSGKSGNPKKSR